MSVLAGLFSACFLGLMGLGWALLFVGVLLCCGSLLSVVGITGITISLFVIKRWK